MKTKISNISDVRENDFVFYGGQIRRVTYREPCGHGWVSIAFDGGSAVDRKVFEEIRIITRETIVQLGATEGAIDGDIAEDNGTPITEREALSALNESADYGSIRDVELRDAYRTAYVAAFLNDGADR